MSETMSEAEPAIASKRRKHKVTGRKGNGHKGSERKKGFGSITKMPSGVFLARWTFKGKHYTKSTGATTEREALAKLEDFTAPFRLENEKDTAEHFQKKVEGVTAEIRDWNASQPGLTFADGWTAYERSQSRPRSGEGTLKNYGQWYELFVEWVTDTHPEVTELRHVTATTASEYAAALLSGTSKEDREKIDAAKRKVAAIVRDPSQGANMSQRDHDALLATARRKVREAVRGTTFNRHMNALALVWTHVAKHPDARITANPWKWDKATGEGIRRITLNHAEKPHRRRALSTTEAFELLNAAQGELRVLIGLGFYTGLRLGDCVLLKWANIDRALGVINVTSRKTDTETTTPVHPALAGILECAATFKSGKGYVMPGLAEQYQRNVAGRVNITRAINALFHQIGIETSAKEDGEARARPDCGFHSLRHTFATLTQTRGAQRETAQKLLGHRTAGMTEHYTHDDGRAVYALPTLTAKDAKTATATIDDAKEQVFRATIAAAVSALMKDATPEELKTAVAYLRDKAREIEKTRTTRKA